MEEKKTLKEEIQKDLFDPGLFMDSADGPALKGCQCPDCNKLFFPPLSRCPECMRTDIAQVPLAGRCRLYSFTTVYIPSKNFIPPYTVGYVEFDQGVRVFAQIRPKEDQELKIGIPMKMVVDYLWKTKDGQKVSAYFFEPEDG